MLPPFIGRKIKPHAGVIGSWLAAQRLRRARLKKQKQLRRRHRLKRLGRAVAAAGGIFLVAMLIGFFGNGIGTDGVLATCFAMAMAFVLLALFPRMRRPALHDLRAAKLAALADTAEAWLEMQRPLMPTRLQGQIDRLGASLDDLSPQLATLGEQGPVAQEIRGLLGEHLPAIVESYARIPEAHRHRPDAAGSTPEAHLSNGLAIIAREIDTLTGRIARGELDELAIRGRYLETRYFGGGEADGA